MVRAITAILALMLVLPACDKKEPESATNNAETAAREAETTAEEEPATAAQTAAQAEEEGQWVTSETYGVKFRVPDDWKTAQDGDSLSVTSPDDTITILLIGTESEGVLSAALDAVKKELEFKDLKLEKDSQTVLNGMPGHTAEGSAVVVKEEGDQGIQFILNAVQAGDRGVAMMVFAEAEMYEARKEEVQGITKTLQKI